MARWCGTGAAAGGERGVPPARRSRRVERRTLPAVPVTPLLAAPLLAALALASLGCESGAPTAAAPAAAAPAAAAPAAAAPAPTGAAHRYGGAIEPGPSVALGTLLANPRAYANQTLTTEGHVQRACSSKGCWMEIGDGDDACRVTFKDYAFFVPTDSAGSLAKIQGKLEARDVEAAAVAHLEAEGARFKHKNADGSATEVRMIASAVELRR